MSHHNQSQEYDPITYVPHVESHGTKEIWRTLWILCFITALDVILYFVMPASGFRNFIFIAFGIIKAYYIVGAFMHMKHEKVDLALVILVPIIFVLGLILGLLYEGNFWLSI